MKNITINGREYTVSAEPDYHMGAPWEESDGHGIVSGWTRRDILAGECILYADGGFKRYYDTAATTEKAKTEGWGIPPELCEGLTPDQITEKAVIRDFMYLQGWCNDDWHWVYMKVTAPDGQCETLGGLASCNAEWLQVIAQELAETLESDYQDAQTEEATI